MSNDWVSIEDAVPNEGVIVLVPECYTHTGPALAMREYIPQLGCVGWSVHPYYGVEYITEGGITTWKHL